MAANSRKCRGRDNSGEKRGGEGGGGGGRNRVGKQFQSLEKNWREAAIEVFGI